jgi:hypothetical protein
LLTHCTRRAASRADWTAGSSKAIRTAMIAITTSNSISVKPLAAPARTAPVSGPSVRRSEPILSSCISV